MAATETALAHSRLVGQDRERKIARQMGVDPGMRRDELVLSLLHGQCGAELGLAAGGAALAIELVGRRVDRLGAAIASPVSEAGRVFYIDRTTLS